MNRARHERQEQASEAAAGVPERGHGAAMEEHLGAGLGIVAGGAAGAIAGPIGVAVGASIGAMVGEIAGMAMHEREVVTSKRDHELDDAIGVTSGPIGAGEMMGFVQPAKIATFLRADHDLLAMLVDTVIEAIVNGDRAEAADVVAAMQRAVTAHLDEEERELLPAYAREAPADAKAIRDEHAALRSALAELDLATDLHYLRADAVKALLMKLRAHADRENTGLYAWARAQGT